MKRIRGIRAMPGSGKLTVPEVQTLPRPRRVILPLGSSWGPLTPLVSAGDRTRVGMKIAEHGEGIYPPLRASISGRVSDIRTRRHYTGAHVLSVCIDAEDNGDKTPGETLSDEKVSGTDPESLTKHIFEAGIRETDPYPWPLHIRIRQPGLIPPVLFPYAPSLRKPVEYLILNTMDRQPGVSLRREALLARGGDLMAAMSVLKDVSAAKKTVLAVAKGHALPDNVARHMERRGVETIVFPDRYPVAMEQMLVNAVTGREVPQPLFDSRSVGAVVVDVITALKVLDAVGDTPSDMKMTAQVVLPGGKPDLRIRVSEGAVLEDVLGQIQPRPENLSKVALGGSFLGYAQHDLSVPLTQEIDCVCLQDNDSMARFTNKPCINCGSCVRSCPVRLVPSELSKFCEYGKYHEAEKNNLFACIECGICAFVCPAKRPMVHILRFGKRELTASMERS